MHKRYYNWALTTVSGFCLCTFLLSSPAHSQEVLEGLGDLAGGTFSSSAAGISADGSVIIGKSQSASGIEAFRWENGIMTGLGDLAGGAYHSEATGISSSGSVIVGFSESVNGLEAFRWEGGVMTGLGDLAGGVYASMASAVSGDGSVVVGVGTSTNGTEAFRWEGGVMTGLGDLAGGGFYSYAYGVNADGSVVVGFGFSASGYEAFRWEGGVMTGLGDLAGGAFGSKAIAVNDDGTVITGVSISAIGNEAFRWEGGVMTGLGDLDGGAVVSAGVAINADGSVIVGIGQTDAGEEAFRWTEETGMIRVEDWLADAGVSLGDFTILSSAYGVSDDGTVITGIGTSSNGTEAYIARVSSIGSGILDTATSTQSIRDSAAVENFNVSMLNLPMFGAHHRPISQMAKDAGQCAWSITDVALTRVSTRDYILNEEIGGCFATLGEKLFIGGGLGINKSSRESFMEGSQDLNGQYVLAEVNYQQDDTSPIFAVTALYGMWDAEISRAYLNAGSRDVSRADTDVSSMALKLAAYMPPVMTWDSNEFGIVTFSPRVSYMVSRTTVDAYTETDGGFPVSFDERKTTQQQVRVGLDAEHKFNEGQSAFRVMLEGVHKFDPNGSAISGELIGISSFSLEPEEGHSDWVRIGAEIDHKDSDTGIRYTASAFGATAGNDPEISMAFSITIPF